MDAGLLQDIMEFTKFIALSSDCVDCCEGWRENSLDYESWWSTMHSLSHQCWVLTANIDTQVFQI